MSADSHQRLGTETAVIEAILQDSAGGWNTQNLGRFMAIYADDPETTYVSGNRITRGFAAIRDIFAARFQAPRNMGKLALDLLDLRRLGPHHLLAIGRFQLAFAENPGTDITGTTSLVFHHDGQRWRVIADHTS